MRILALVTDAFGGIGGIAQYNRDFLTAASSYPACREIVVLPRRLEYEEKTPSKVKYLTPAAKGKLNYLWELVKAFLGNRDLDLIFCGHLNLLPLAFFSRAFGLKAPIVLVVHGIEAWSLSRPRWLRFLTKRISASIAVSEYTKNRFLDGVPVNGRRNFIIPPAVDSHLYRRGPKNPALLERYGLKNKIVILTLARLSSSERYKGIDEVLDLLPRLIQEIANVTYMIAGEGDDRSRLEKKVERLGIRDHVVFTNVVPESEKPDFYRLADVFVMPSRAEGFGIVYLEAMACGVPVIASGVDATAETLKELPLAFFANPDYPEEIQQAVLKAIKIRNQNVDPHLDDFSMQNFSKRIHEFLDSVT